MGFIFRVRRHWALVAVVFLLLGALMLLAFPVPGRAANINKPVKGQANTQSTFNDSKLTVSDVDGDGVEEILAGNTNGYMYCFTPKAEVKWAKYVGAAIMGGAAC